MIYIQKWKIELYKTESGEYPVLNYIQSLSPKQRTKIERGIDLLELYGIFLPFPYKRKILGYRYKNLWELRIRFGENRFRIVYFLYRENIFILVNAFSKKERKGPKNELEIARSRMMDFLSRNKGAK